MKWLSLTPILLTLGLTNQQTYTLNGAVSAVTGATSYQVYYGTSPRNYSARIILTPPIRQFQIPGLKLKTAYYISATAMVGGLESLYGNELRYVQTTAPKKQQAATASVP